MNLILFAKNENFPFQATVKSNTSDVDYYISLFGILDMQNPTLIQVKSFPDHPVPFTCLWDFDWLLNLTTIFVQKLR